jgi:polysaccharide export outer membrane protein
MGLFHGNKVEKSMEIMAAFILFFLITAPACQTVRPARTPQELAAAPEPKLFLGSGDSLDVKFFNNPELNETQTVRPDGKIALQLVGEVMAGGKTPGELQKELVRLYTPHLRTPDVTVIVRSFANRRVYVGGHVKNAQFMELKPQMTALEAIMQAGGFDLITAEPSNVVIVRHKEGKRYGAALDLSGAIQGRESQPFYLEPLDIVYVPRSKISKVNLWIDQYINLMIPRVGFTYLAPLGSGATIGIQQTIPVITRP